MDDLLKLETETFNKLYTDYRLRFIRFAAHADPEGGGQTVVTAHGGPSMSRQRGSC